MSASFAFSQLAIVRASARKRLWLFAAGAAVLITTFWTAHALFPPEQPKDPGFGLDFIAFYTAGDFVREGRQSELYDLEAVHRFQLQLAAKNHFDIGRTYGPWWNPPFYALVFAPMSRLPYPAASALWIGIGLLCFAFACGLLWGILPAGMEWKSRGLVPVLMVLSAPFILAVSHAQNTPASLLLLTGTVLLWRRGRALVAGLVGGLMFYKPQVAAVLAIVLVLDLGWKAVAGYAITGTSLLLVNVLALPGTLAHYLHQLPINVHSFQTGTPYPWEQHITLKAFWRLLLHGHALGDPAGIVTVLSSGSALALGALLLIAAWNNRSAFRSGGVISSNEDKAARDRLIVATIVSAPLLMPFYFDYDLLLLSVPAVLFANELVTRGARAITGRERWLIAAWIALYIWQMVNDQVGGRTHVNFSVLLLLAISLLSISRCFARRVSTESGTRYDSPRLAAAA